MNALKAAKYTKKKNLVYRRFKCGDDIFDTRTHNLADVSSFSPCVISLLLRVVESGSALPTDFDFPCSSIKLTTCRVKFAHISQPVETVEGLCIS